MRTYPRFTGVFRQEDDGYGFLMNVKGINGQAPDGIPQIDGDQGGVFLSGSTARATLGSKKALMRHMNGSAFSFAIRESETHPGKLEAFDVSDPMSSAVI